MIQVDRLHNNLVPNAVVRELWDYLSDDSPIEPWEFDARVDETSRWYASWEDAELLGVYWARQLNHVTWEIHTNVRLAWWGSGKTVPHAKATLQFIFDDTGAHKMNAIIPETATHVLRYAKEVGFVEEGRSKESLMKNGKLQDQIYLGITKDSIL